MKISERKTERLVARVRNDVKTTIEKAAAYSGASVSQFMIDSALDKANTVINDMEILKVSDDAFKKMMDVLDNPPEPNAYLLKMKENYINNGYADNKTIKDT